MIYNILKKSEELAKQELQEAQKKIQEAQKKIEEASKKEKDVLELLYDIAGNKQNKSSSGSGKLDVNHKTDKKK